MIKIILVTVAIIILLFFVGIIALFLRIPNRLLEVFNKVSIQKATQLAQDCQVKTTGEPHSGGIILNLVNGSSKYLENNYQVVNHFREYNLDYKQFFELIHNSEDRCGFRVQSFIE